MPPPRYPVLGDFNLGPVGLGRGGGTGKRKRKPPPRAPGQPGLPLVDSLLGQVNAELEALYGPQKAEIDRLQGEETSRTAARADLIRGLYAQLAAMQKGVAPAVQGAFQSAAQNTTAFSKGYSDGLQQTLGSSAGEANALQGLIGAPEGQRVQGGEAAANVLYGTTGAIPASTLETQGAAFGSAAAYLPGATFGKGMIDIQTLLGESAERLRGLDAEERALVGKQTSDRQQLLAERRKEKKAEAMDLYEAGFISQREFARRLGVKNWKKFPNSLAGEDPDIELRTVGGDLIAVDKNTGKTKVVHKGKPEKDKWHYFQTSDGADWRINETTGKREQLGGAKTTSPTIRGSQKDGYTAFDPVTGKPIYRTKGTGVAKSTEPLWKQAGYDTPGQMNATARRLAKETQGGGIDRYGKPIDPDKPKMSAREAYDHLVAEGVPEAVARKVLRRYYPKAKFPKAEPASGGAGYSGDMLVPSTSWSGTHITDGLDWNHGQKTATDIMAAAGTPVGAPESGRVVRHSSAQGGQAMWFLSDSGVMYWLGHIDGMVPVGTRVRRGQRIAYISGDHPAPHLHIDRRRGSGA